MDLRERLARFAPVALTAERDRLDERQRTLVQHLIAAGRKIGEIYLRQMWPGNPDMQSSLAASSDPQDRLRLRLFELMGGPWDRSDDDRPFIGEQPRPAGSAFYPADLTRQELEAWLEIHPEDRPAFSSYFTVIRRRGDSLEARPYHQVYREWLEPAAKSLQAAAGLADHPPLAEYLSLRAQALLDDNYFASDCAWVALQDGPIEVVVGPYEVYDDKLFGYKASYECLVGLRDIAESARFRNLIDYLPTMAAHLPVTPEYRGTVAGLASPIVVTETVYNAGQTAIAALPTAFVLPNDAHVRTTVGTKKVMVKNVAHAKFENILRPVSQDILHPDQAAMVAFEVYFVNVLLHEISHALGAREVLQPDGTRWPLHQALRDLYSPIEECKADIVGLYNVLFLAAEGVFPREWGELAPVAHLAGIFRMVRMGTTGAHALGNRVAFNFLWEAGAIRQDRETGRFQAEPGRMAQGVADLAGILLRIEGDGDYKGAQALVQRYGRQSGKLEEALGQIRRDLPMDLAPTYPWAE